MWQQFKHAHTNTNRYKIGTSTRTYRARRHTHTHSPAKGGDAKATHLKFMNTKSVQNSSTILTSQSISRSQHEISFTCRSSYGGGVRYVLCAAGMALP